MVTNIKNTGNKKKKPHPKWTKAGSLLMDFPEIGLN
jgi:hypothetical protein